MAEIAKELNISVRTVQCTILKPQVKERKRGRPTKLSQKDQRNLLQKLYKKPLLTAHKLISSVGKFLHPHEWSIYEGKVPVLLSLSESAADAAMAQGKMP